MTKLASTEKHNSSGDIRTNRQWAGRTTHRTASAFLGQDCFGSVCLWPLRMGLRKRFLTYKRRVTGLGTQSRMTRLIRMKMLGLKRTGSARRLMINLRSRSRTSESAIWLLQAFVTLASHSWLLKSYHLGFLLVSASACLVSTVQASQPLLRALPVK